MARYLPDSVSLVRFARGQRREREWFQRMLNSAEQVGCCQLTIGECYAGARPLEREGWKEIFDTLLYWPIAPEDAAQAGIWRYDFRQRGFQRELADLMIAAVAMRMGATVITDNLKDFVDIPGVRVMSLPIQS